MAHWTDDWLLEKLKEEVRLSADVSYALLNWARFAKERGPVALVGAGMSLNANAKARYRELGFTGEGKPRALMWDALAERLRGELRHQGDVGNADALWLAELYEQAYGKEALQRAVEEAVPDRFLEPGNAHFALFEIGWRAVLTTNYDTLIQRAWEQARTPGRLRVCVDDADLVRSVAQEEALELVHLHGVIDRPETIVLTLEHYRRYAERSPGLLAKVRQLFLQHPVLLLGVGATDPNFIQWSGWIRDLVGEQRNPWISLVVGTQPGAARRSYWHGALQFVPVGKDDLSLVIRLLGKYLGGLDRAAAKESALRWIQHAESIEVLFARIPELMTRFEPIPGRDSSNAKLEILAAVLRRAFELRYGRDRGLEQWERIETLPAEFASARGDVSRVSVVVKREEQRQLLLNAIGSHWVSWLTMAVEHVGIEFRIAYLWFVASSEEKLLPADTSADLRAGLRRAIARRRLSFQAENGGESFEDEQQDELVLQTEDWHHDLMQLRRLQSGSQLLSEPEPRTAQDFRRSAFARALAGKLSESTELYARAAAASRDASEPDWIEWLTLKSALRVSALARDESVLRSADLDLLKGRVRKLEAQKGGLVNSLREFETEARDELLLKFDKSYSGPEFLPSRARELLDTLERHWVAPWIVSEWATRYGQAEWDAGRVVEAVRVLVRYGSSSLEQLIAVRSKERDRESWSQDLLSLLTEEGRWALEWLARAESLKHVVPDLSREQLTLLVEWVGKAVSVMPRDGLPRTRGKRVYSEFDVFKPLAELLVEIWSYLPPERFLQEWPQFCEVHYPKGHPFVAALARSLSGLPLWDWLKDSRLEPALVDHALALALNVTQALPGRVERFKVGEWIVRLLNVPELMLPKEGLAAKSVKNWLEDAKDEHLLGHWTRLVGWKVVAGSDGQEFVSRLKACVGVARDSVGAGKSAALEAVAEVVEVISEEEMRFFAAALGGCLDEILRRRQSNDVDVDFDIRAVAFFAVRLIERGPSDVAGKCREVLMRAVGSSVLGLETASWVSSVLLGERHGEFISMVTEYLFRRGVVANLDARLFALNACQRHVAINREERLPVEWVLPLCLMVREDDFQLAQVAFAVLARAIAEGRLPLPVEGWLQQCLMTIVRGSDDARPRLVGAAAAALVKIESSGAVDGELARVMTATLTRLREDKRSGVLAEVEAAQARMVAASERAVSAQSDVAIS